MREQLGNSVIGFDRKGGKSPLPETIWLVVAEWKGGHDRRDFRLINTYTNEKVARAAWDELTPERHNRVCGFPVDFDAGFVRHPMRRYDLTLNPEP
ncbi:hypothetical protein [Croceicoccus sp. BE223]|uniref:hypothetical protein n=1 Tax=Croceicoccus sp. BE223 TaxID=2817716 RepID=UPI002864D45A|nr:hypothetical protein [Croceicoccus sp. BE223]MDR7101432.1 hypothetical protein [Croceicoccus sp. BE223]